MVHLGNQSIYPFSNQQQKSKDWYPSILPDLPSIFSKDWYCHRILDLHRIGGGGWETPRADPGEAHRFTAALAAECCSPGGKCRDDR